MEFREAIATRRSQYMLSRDVKIKTKDIESVIESCVIHAPSAFDSKVQRTVLLLGANHDALWDIVLETLRKIVPADSFAATERRISGFKAAYATVLFYLDDAVTEELKAKFPAYAASFPVFAEQAGGMLQYMVWSSLESIGLGASLQHYNPLIDEEVRRTFDIPSTWRLTAQMPFGAIVTSAAAKDLSGREANLVVKR